MVRRSSFWRGSEAQVDVEVSSVCAYHSLFTSERHSYVHRLSGYILFPLLMVTTALGGASHWAQKLLPASVRLIIYGVGSAVVLAAVMVRMRYALYKDFAGYEH